MAITLCKVTWRVPAMRNSSTAVLTVIPNAPGGDASKVILEGGIPLSEWGTSYSVSIGETIVQDLPHANLPATVDGETPYTGWTYTFMVTSNSGSSVSEEVQPLKGIKTLNVDVSGPVQAIIEAGKVEDTVIVIGGKVEVVEDKVQQIELVTDGLDVKLNDFQETLDGYDTEFSDIRVSLDGKTNTYRSTAEPIMPASGFNENDTWYDLTNNVIKQWVNDQWVPTVLGADALSQSVRDTITQAQTDASTAATQASTALTAANGKNTVYYGSTDPTAPPGGFREGDTWMDNGTNTIRVRVGSEWVIQSLGTSSLVNGAVTSDKMLSGTITAASGIIADAAITNIKIADAAITNAKILNLDAAKITTGLLSADRIGANTITGTMINGNTVTANNMVAGTITAASGIIADAAITNAKIANVDAGKITTGFISAAVIAVGSITADKVLIGSGQNAAIDPDFRIADAWSTPTWIQSTGARLGTGPSALIPASTTMTSLYAGTQPEHTVPVHEGEVYNLSIYYSSAISVAAANRLSLVVRYRTAAGAWGTATTIAQNPGTVTANTWTRLQGLTVVPAGVTHMAIGFTKASMHDGAVRLSDPTIRVAANGELIVDGAIDGRVITGATIRTSGTVGNSSNGQGVLLDQNRLSAYAPNGVRTFNVSANTGLVEMIGGFQTAASGPRLQAYQGSGFGALRIYTDADSDSNFGQLFVMRNSNSSRVFRLGMNGNNNGTDHGFIQVGESDSRIRQNYNGTDNESASIYVTNNGSYEAVAFGTGGTTPNSMFYGRQNGDFSIGGRGAGRVTLDKVGNALVVNKDDGHKILLANNGWTYMYGLGVNVQGALTVTGSKNFVMDHPTKPNMMLKHASTESPHNGVEYWSDEPVTLDESGNASVTLPDYFGDLTDVKGRVVILTAHVPNAGLWAEIVTDTRFAVHGAPHASFSWLVKARRVQLDETGRDILSFDSEYAKTSTSGDAGVAPEVPVPTLNEEIFLTE